jgi:hypothetical protein
MNMAVLAKWMIAAATGLACASTTAAAATLEAALLPRVRAATFEVVSARADDSKVVYEKPLPLDQMPYQERTDKYASIGTAFAIGDNRFVTALHVFADGIGSLRGPLSLRDEQGHVYAVDKVLRFSPQQDFVEFTLVQPPKVQPLEVEASPGTNESVFAVGNALGTGVVLRDGLYTSDTPEEVDGRWKWIRFSAPASPGNSGGPLIDEKGKVIGVVLRKSPSENLNYALPIHYVLDASDKEAAVDLPQDFGVAYSTETRHSRLRDTIALPLTQAAFNTRVATMVDASLAKEAQAWLKERAATLYPQGVKSHDLLTRSAWTGGIPALISQDNAGTWVRPAEDNAERSPLPNKGYIDRTVVNDIALWHIHSEADAPAITGGRAVMDPLLTLGFVTRKVGQERIKVTSLGEPASTETFTDRLGRTWHIDAFSVPFLNAYLMVVTTPVPDGAVGMLTISSAKEKSEHALQMRLMADMEDVAYTGTLAQWQAFLAHGAPASVLKNATVSHDSQGAALAIDGLRARWPATLVPASTRTDVAMASGWTMGDGKPELHVQRLALSQQDSPNAVVYLDRYERPFDDSSQAANDVWNDVVKHAHPRDGKPYETDEWRLITRVYDPAQPQSANHVYTLGYAVRDKTSDDDMKARLADASRGTEVPGAKAAPTNATAAVPPPSP